MKVINMKATIAQRFISLLIVTFVSLALVAGCGGSGSSATGGGGLAGSSSIAGNVNSGISFHQQAYDNGGVLAAITNMLVSPAFAAGVAGVEVELLLNGAVVDSQITDGSGNFLFNDLPSGNYSLRLMMDGQNVGESPPISLDPNTKTKLELNLDGSVINMKVEAEESQIAGEVNDDGMSDDMLSDDDSDDDESYDDDSDDDESSDDDSLDADSDDDNSDDSV
jgi:hypothetical protein